MGTDCVYVMCVWGGLRRAIDKHFKVGKMQPLWNQVPDDESTLNRKTPAFVQLGRCHGSRVRAWK